MCVSENSIVVSMQQRRAEQDGAATGVQMCPGSVKLVPRGPRGEALGPD